MEKGIKRGSKMIKMGKVVKAIKLTAAGWLMAFMLPVVSSQGLTLPLQETFEKEQLGPAWTTVVSGGNSVAVKDGWLRIDAHEDGLAHIERSLGMDNVTVTAKIANCPSLYLLWDEANWCGVGKVSPTPFGRFYSTVTTGNRTSEMKHRGCFVHSPHYVRLQIGRKCIRIEYSNEGQEWLPLRILDRPSKFSGAPAIVAFGKHYLEGQEPMSGSKVAIGEGDRGGRYGGIVTDIRIEETPETAWAMTAEERRYMKRLAVSDPDAKELLRGKDDPTFDEVAKHFPPMRYPREVVGVPEHPLDIGINYLGQLDISPWEAAYSWIEVGEPPVPFWELNSEPPTRQLQDGYLPVLLLTTQRDGVKYTQTVFGYSKGMAPEEDLFCYVSLKARATGNASLPGEITLVSARSDGRWTYPLEKGRGKVAEVCLRIKHPDPATATRITGKEFRAKRAEMVDHWQKRLSGAMRFEVPDPRVNEAYRAWLVYWMLNTDRINGYPELHDGAGFYDIIFGNSMCLHNIGVDLYGMHDYAERCYDTQLHFQNQDTGLYVQECGLPDHGSLIWALAHHYQITRDVPWLKRVAPQLIKACEWVMRQREAAPQDDPITRGLIKFRPYNDYPQPVFNYLGNMYCSKGLEDAAEVLRDIGMDKEADRYASEGRKYRQDILASMDAASFKDGDLTVLPIEPDTHRMLKLSHYRGGDYYGLVASCLFTMEFLDSEDPRAYWLTEMLEKRKGLVAGVCEFMEGIDHAYTYGYLMTLMRRDEVRKVLLGFNSMLAFGMSRDTYSPVEVTQLGTGENHLTLPHSYSCTDQLRLFRNMLVREEGDTLWIGQAVPRAWLEPGKKVVVTEAPTPFGPVSYQFEAGSDTSVKVRLVPPTREPAGVIKIRLRHPKRWKIASVQATPDAEVELSRETLSLREWTKPVEIEVTFKK